MTYLDLINNVLRRLRQDVVTSVNLTEYSKMVGDFVNDAKNIIETSWDWSALRSTLTISATSGDYTYSLTGSGDNGRLLLLMNDTSNCQMEYKAKEWFDNEYYVNNPVSGSPRYYTYSGLDSSGDTQIDIYPRPDDSYTLKAQVVNRNSLLTNDTDVLAIPSQPVIHLAVALLARERGETGGTSAAEYFGIADKFLSDAIAIDAAKHPEETIFYTP